MLPPTHVFGFLVTFVVLTSGVTLLLPKEFRDHERRSFLNQSDYIESEVKRKLEGTMYSEDCALIGTIGVGETYKLDVRNSQAADNVPNPLTPARNTDFKAYSLNIMCPEDAHVEVEHAYIDRRFHKDKFQFDSASSRPYLFHSPSLIRHMFNITNLGSNSQRKIMFKLQVGGERCDEVKLWQEERQKRKKDPFAEKLNRYVEGVELRDAVSKITNALASLVPIPGFSSVVELIWSYVKPSEWYKKVNEVLGHIKNATIEQNLIANKQRLLEVEISIQNLEKIRKSNPTDLHFYIHFSQVSEKLLTEQMYFQFHDLESNLASLPLLTITMSLIVQFFSVVLKDPLYKMNDERMKTVETTRTTVLENVNKHILRLYDHQMASAFNNCDEANLFGRTQIYIYDCVVDAHNLVAMQGLKFLSAWNKLAHFDSNDTRTIHVPIYSHYFGRQTDDLIRDLYLSNMTALLTPPVYDLWGCYRKSPNPTCFLRKRVTSVNVIFADRSDSKQISMVLFSYDDEREFDKHLGVKRYYSKNYYRTFDVKEGVYIKKIRTGVNNKMRYIEFYMSDDSIQSYGRGFYDKSIPETTFELPDHHIADILVKSDDENHFRYGPVAYGVSVSYLPTPLKNSKMY